MDDTINLYQKNIKLASYFVAPWMEFFPQEYYDDLVGEARIALWKACCHYDPNSKNRFTTYAARVINNQITDFYRKNKNYIYIRSKSLQENSNQKNEKNPRTFSEEVGYEIDYDNIVLYNTIMEVLHEYPALQMNVEGMSQADIGRALDRTRAAINQRIKRDKEKIIDRFKLYNWEENSHDFIW